MSNKLTYSKRDHNTSFAFFSELLGREELWNIALSVPALFSLVQVIVLPFLPEAPRYLFIEKGCEKACIKGWYVYQQTHSS